MRASPHFIQAFKNINDNMSIDMKIFTSHEVILRKYSLPKLV